jgi:lauroyl/myristoyl acyltransferase
MEVTMGLNISSFLQWRFNIYVYQKLGWRLTYYYVKILAWLYYLINHQEKSRIHTAVETVFSQRKKKPEREALMKKVMQGIVAHYYEKLFNAYATGATLRAFVGSHVDFTGIGTLEKGLKHNKGLLLITGHVGGVELIPACLGYRQFPVTIIAKFSSRHLWKASEQQARRFRTRIIDAERTPNIMQALLANLKENRVVITQCDEFDEWRPSRCDQISFLGKQIRLDRTFNVLARRIDAPIAFGIMHRRQNHHYRFSVVSEDEMAGSLKAMAPLPIGAVALKYLEHYIYNHPAGWYQWKKYPSIVPLASSTGPANRQLDPTLLDPSIGEIALRRVA